MRNGVSSTYVSTFRVEGRDFTNAGSVSMQIKALLRSVGVHPTILRRAAIACYEAEMNVVMYAKRAQVTLQLTPRYVKIVVRDVGPGIEDIDEAMREGFSTASKEMREMGFGAGMGLPNMRKNADILVIESTPGRGTTIEMVFRTSFKPQPST